jgi:hypothetical protein
MEATILPQEHLSCRIRARASSIHVDNPQGLLILTSGSFGGSGFSARTGSGSGDRRYRASIEKGRLTWYVLFERIFLKADMVERGEVLFDDPIEQFLPGDVAVSTYNGRSITLIDLATHTSGLPNIPDNLALADENNPYADYTVEQMYEALAQIHLAHGIGAWYEYSNLGMGLLGHVLSLSSGLSYEDLVVGRITDELEMFDTRVTLTRSALTCLATPLPGHWPSLTHHHHRQNPPVRLRVLERTKTRGCVGIQPSFLHSLKRPIPLIR